MNATKGMFISTNAFSRMAVPNPFTFEFWYNANLLQIREFTFFVNESKISWAVQFGKENQFITNYVPRAEGMWNNHPIKRIGPLENQMHINIK